MQYFLKQLMFITSHKVRRPVTTCIGLINLIETDDRLPAEEVKMILQYLKAAMNDLDEETRNMSILLHHKKEQSDRKFESSFYGNINKNPG